MTGYKIVICPHDVTVEYVDYDFDEDNPRVVHITIVLKFWARVVSTTQMDVYSLESGQLGKMELPSGTYLGENAVSSAGGSTDVASASSTGGGESVASASSTGGGNIAGYGYENVFVTGPGITPTAGTITKVSGTVQVTGTVVNVRSGPGTNYPVVTQVKKGDQVTIKDQAFGWYKVVLPDGSTTGWIASWLLTAPATTTTVPTTTMG